MFNFHRKNWFPYTFPFLVYFCIEQAIEFLPAFRLQLHLTQVMVCGTMLWLWRKHFGADTSAKMSSRQLFIAITFAVLGLAAWLLCARYQPVQLAQVFAAAQYPDGTHVAVAALCALGFITVSPLMCELFWRSFMLRYLITPDFRSVALGTPQAFSFVMVVILASFASSYAAALAITSTLQNILMVWQKNLRCCIVSHALTNALLVAAAVYQLLYGH